MAFLTRGRADYPGISIQNSRFELALWDEDSVRISQDLAASSFLLAFLIHLAMVVFDAAGHFFNETFNL